MDILDYKGDVIISVDPCVGSVRKVDLMSGDTVSLRFNLADPIVFPRGCYIREDFGWYILTEDYKPKWDKSTGGYNYTLELQAWYYFWNGRILTYQPKFGAVETSFSLTAPIHVHWGVILDNLRYAGLNIYEGNPPVSYVSFMENGHTDDKGHKYAKSEEGYRDMLAYYHCKEVSAVFHMRTGDEKVEGLIENVSKGLSYESVKITDALNVICGENGWKCEWWFEEEKVHFGHLGYGSTKETKEWKLGHELEDISRAESNEEFATRLIAFGSTRNVPERYRKKLVFDVKDPSSPYVDTFRRMRAEWFASGKRITESVPYSKSGQNISLNSDRTIITDSFDVRDAPKYSITDISVSFTYPAMVYSPSKKKFVNFNTDNRFDTFISKTRIEVLQIDTEGGVSNNVIKASMPVVYTTLQNGNNITVTMTVDDFDGEARYVTTGLVLCLYVPTDVVGFVIPDAGQTPSSAYPQSDVMELYKQVTVTSISCKYTKKNNYKVHTTAHVLTGAHAGDALPVTINDDQRIATAYESGHIKGLSSLAVGDFYTLDNVLTGKVKLEYFTDEMSSKIIGYERRLMLPIETYPKNYMDSSRIKDGNGKIIESQIVEVVKVYDDIYPKQELSIAKVLEYETHEQNPEDPNNPDALLWTKHYRLLIPKSDFDFSEDFLTEDKLEVQFQTGDLAGMTFSIIFLKKGYGDTPEEREMLCYEIEPSETYGISLPNDVMFPKAGDKIVFFNYDPSQLSTGEGNMVLSAEKRLEEEAKKTLKKIELDTGRYTCPLLSDYAKSLYDNGDMPQMGDPIRVFNYGYFSTYRESRVIGMEIKLDIPYDTPKYIIGEDEAYSRSAETAKQIAAATAKITNISGLGGGTGYTPNEIRNMVQEYGMEYFLSKLNDDMAAGNISFNQSITVRNNATVGGELVVGGVAGSTDFLGGPLGYGWRIKNADGEMDSLALRRWLEVPELRYNRISVNTGVDWHTFGAGIIEEVHPIDGTHGWCKLKLEDGEVGEIAIDDKCMGIWHNETNTSVNADTTTDGHKVTITNDDGTTEEIEVHDGNFTFAGFDTVYFKVTGLCDENGNALAPDHEGDYKNQYFRYELRSNANDERFGTEAWDDSMEWTHQSHPYEGMHFSAYANYNNSTRQACDYSTTTYKVNLVGMRHWTYDGNNISFLSGLLDGFSVPAMRLNADGEWESYDKRLRGTGIGFGNAYMWGTLDQFTRDKFVVSQQMYNAASTLSPEEMSALDDFRNLPDDAGQWTTTPQEPSSEFPYLYTYWEVKYSNGETEFKGPTLSGYDSAALTVRLDKDIVSLAINEWYDETDVDEDGNVRGDDLSFSVRASLYLGNRQIEASEADVVSAMNYTVESIKDGDDFILYITIKDFVGQQVERVLAENTYVTIVLKDANGISVEKPLTIVENRQGDDGQGEKGDKGDDAVVYQIQGSSAIKFGSEASFYLFKTENGKTEAFSAAFLVAAYDGSRWYTYYNPSGDHIFYTPQFKDKSLFVGAFTTKSDALNYYAFLNGIKNTSPAPLASVMITSVPLEVSLVPSMTNINYPIGNDRTPEDNTFKVYVELHIGDEIQRNVDTSKLDVVQSYGVRGIQMVGIDSDDRGAYVEFEPYNEPCASLVQTFRVTYRGEYERSCDIGFCAVTAGLSSQGEQGVQGCVVRLRGVYSEKSSYVNERDLKGLDGVIRWIDVVQLREVDNSLSYYMRLPFESGQSGIYPTDILHWVKADYMPFIATDLILAEEAVIKFGQNNQLLIVDEDGTIVGGLSGYGNEDAKDIRIWVGAPLPENAPFKVYHDGTMVAANMNNIFQDLSGCTTYATNCYYLSLKSIREGTDVYRDGVAVHVKKNVYNIVLNEAYLRLPNDAEFIGQRVIVCSTRPSDLEQATYVEQEQSGVTFIGAGVFYSTSAGNVNSIPVDNLHFGEVDEIAFSNGTMEFIAVPYGSGCKWSLINDGTSIKWYKPKGATEFKLITIGY